MTEITIEDLRKAKKEIHDTSPCTCKFGDSMFCPKHNILRIPKEQQKLIKEIFGIQKEKN